MALALLMLTVFKMVSGLSCSAIFGYVARRVINDVLGDTLHFRVLQLFLPFREGARRRNGRWRPSDDAARQRGAYSTAHELPRVVTRWAHDRPQHTASTNVPEGRGENTVRRREGARANDDE